MERSKLIPIIGISIVAVFASVMFYGVIKMSLPPSRAEVNEKISDNLVKGDYDQMLRNKCVEKLNSYGIEYTQGDVNLCVDAAKGFGYMYLNK